MNRKLRNLITITFVLLLGNIANGQTDQNFNALLSAYQKAAIQYDLSEATNDISETNYWREQYHFYKQRLEKIIFNNNQLARENPRTYCLPALNSYNRYIQVNSSTVIASELKNDMYHLDSFFELQKYCARFDIYYDPNQRM